MRIAVLFGGTSDERDVSIASAAQVVPALRGLGHEVFAVDSASGRLLPADETRLLTAGVAPAPPDGADMELVRHRAATLSTSAFDLRGADVVFLALHGGAGEDGRVQAMLDLAGIAYTASNHIASAAAMDKEFAKRLFRSVDVPTAEWLMAPVSAAEVERALGWPVVVKPSKQGSTVGLSVVRPPADCAPAIAVAEGFDNEVMIEKFIAGREFTDRSTRSAALEKYSPRRFQLRSVRWCRNTRCARTACSSSARTAALIFDATAAAASGAWKRIRCPE